ncbi:hypothetical protein ADIWIN_2857 [Winogradskyella psychrotolerans RS-3]|uniref:Uncharacterized protein n=1 Tax=Winogradskyella psychrotolerans RS-3 TaxID=641526 RepID=S7X7J4_9FLAO|nr:hypothetical protein ADIWIN_2857 [Winogradskyella psychrotolerans RS-3]
MAPKTAQIKNTRDGENRSLSVKMAKIKVPIINPNCTEELM